MAARAGRRSRRSGRRIVAGPPRPTGRAWTRRPARASGGWRRPRPWGSKRLRRKSLASCVVLRPKRPLVIENSGETSMRGVLALWVLVLGPLIAVAGSPEKFYYLGEVRLTSPAGKAIGSQV